MLSETRNQGDTAEAERVGKELGSQIARVSREVEAGLTAIPRIAGRSVYERGAKRSQQSSRAPESSCFMIRSLGVRSKSSTTAILVRRELVGREAEAQPSREGGCDADHGAILDRRMGGDDLLDLPPRKARPPHATSWASSPSRACTTLPSARSSWR